MTVNGTELTKEKGGADMKKTATISAILAVVGFMAVYVALCYLVPGWRLKLEAPAMEYFVASLLSVFFTTILTHIVLSQT